MTDISIRTIRQQAQTIGQWILLGSLAGVAAGAASALFLYLLDLATEYRNGNETIVYTLPVAGLVIGTIYARWGTSIKGGNNLIIDTIHDDSPQIPVRMAPMVLAGTVLTHLFGGSAGREGTGVQMGASLADEIAHRFRVSPQVRRELLAAGIAGGFGSIFGTPVAGMIFGMEVVCLGAISYEALVPALVASFVGDYVTRSLGINHTPYPHIGWVDLSVPLFLKWIVFAVAVAVTAAAFIELTHFLNKQLGKYFPSLPVRMFAGGVVIVILWKLLGTGDYLGLGVPMILRSFSDPDLPQYAFVLKLLFTAITLGAGFLGGEVTPLFFIGAALGSALAGPLGIPLELAAGVGLAAVFAAAANTPLALSVMAVELMGASVLPHVIVVCVVAYLLSGHRGIYPSQRVTRLKHGGPPLQRRVPLRDIHSGSSGEGI